jgi:hypothetical protein
MTDANKLAMVSLHESRVSSNATVIKFSIQCKEEESFVQNLGYAQKMNTCDSLAIAFAAKTTQLTGNL